MSEIHVLLDNSQCHGFGLVVSKNESHKGGLVIKEISHGMPASKANLKIGDHIVKVNHKKVKSGRDAIVAEINESKSDKLILVIKRDVKEPQYQSVRNLSSLSSLMNSSIQNFRNSKSSVDLNYSSPTPKQILDSNYVPEDTIKNFIQEDSHEPSQFRERSPSLFGLEASLDDCRADSESPQSSHKQCDEALSGETNVQFTRKQAYRKISEDADNIHQCQVPRYNLKKATNTGSVTQKDPVYTVKKKLNSFAGDGQYQTTKNSISLANPKSRITASPSPRNAILTVRSGSNSSINKSQTPSPIYYQSKWTVPPLEDDNSLSSSMTSGNKSSIQSASAPLQLAPTTVADITPFPVDVEMKIIMFKEKIPKPIWKKYVLGQEATGVIFECYDMSEMQSSSNSTALIPSVANAELIMNLWNINNNPNRFYLPIGQVKFDDDIIREATFDEIKITSSQLKLDFSINLIKVPSQDQERVFRLLQVDPPELKLPVVKPKKSTSAPDHFRTEVKKSKLSKATETIYPLLSSLHKTQKVQGVPLVVIVCISIVESIGIKLEGIYRKCGNIVCRRLLEDIVSNENPDKWSNHEEWTNVHTTSNLLKSILRKFILIDKDTTIKLSVIRLDIEEPRNEGDTDRKFQAIMDMIYHLYTHFKSHNSSEENKCRLDTFKYVIKHLYRVSLFIEYTKMTAENLAMCFMPNLIEDIPSDEDTEYKTSKKNLIYENLRRMVAFWITYADEVCEFLEEDKEDELSKKVRNFLNQKHTPNHADMYVNNNFEEKDIAFLVKERIEYFTESLVGSECNSTNISHSNIYTPDSFFSRTKNSRLYQSVKQPKKLNVRRRNSSGSPIDATKPLYGIKPLDVNRKPNAVVGIGSPPISRKSGVESWTSKNVKKKKDSSPGDISGIELSSLLISGCKKDVPLVVVACIDIIEKFGIDIDGIYRISGRNQEIINLDTLVMNNDTDSWLLESNIKVWANMHNTACLMKRILKKFCLIPKETWKHMTSQFSEKLEPDDVKNVLKAAAYYLRVEQSKFNFVTSSRIDHEDYKNDNKQYESRFRNGTLRYVLQHLKHVSMHESLNRMTSNSLAVCFVPVLMEEDYSSDMIITNTKCIQIVQLLIDHYDWIFQWDGKPSEDLYGQKMSDSLENHLKNYSPTTCNETHQKNPVFTADYNEIQNCLRILIESSFHLSDMDADSLRIYFANVALSSHLPMSGDAM